MAGHSFVSYLRVSTDKQGSFGLGIEAQRAAVASYLSGFGASLTAEFVELESGKRADRPELARALAECRVRQATLVIAKLDRPARDTLFLLGLERAGIAFTAAGGRPENLKNAEIGRQRATETRRAKAASRAADLAPVIAAIRAEGVTTATAIAKALNDRGIPTTRGGHWQAVQVQRLLRAAGSAGSC